MSGLFEALGGRKNTTVVLSIVAIAVLAGLGHLQVARFVDVLTWLVGIGVGGIALEDGLAGFGKKKK